MGKYALRGTRETFTLTPLGMSGAAPEVKTRRTYGDAAYTGSAFAGVVGSCSTVPLLSNTVNVSDPGEIANRRYVTSSTPSHAAYTTAAHVSSGAGAGESGDVSYTTHGDANVSVCALHCEHRRAGPAEGDATRVRDGDGDGEGERLTSASVAETSGERDGVLDLVLIAEFVTRDARDEGDTFVVGVTRDESDSLRVSETEGVPVTDAQLERDAMLADPDRLGRKLREAAPDVVRLRVAGVRDEKPLAEGEGDADEHIDGRTVTTVGVGE